MSSSFERTKNDSKPLSQCRIHRSVLRTHFCVRRENDGRYCVRCRERNGDRRSQSDWAPGNLETIGTSVETIVFCVETVGTIRNKKEIIIYILFFLFLQFPRFPWFLPQFPDQVPWFPQKCHKNSIASQLQKIRQQNYMSVLFASVLPACPVRKRGPRTMLEIAR